MQTFLPYPSFERSAGVLDDRRLGKQRVEVMQVLRALHLDGYGWSNHPAVLMWRGHTRALVAYGVAVVEEWCRRGYADSTRPNIVEFAAPLQSLAELPLTREELPSWLGWARLHRSHRAALVRKEPAIYAAVFPDVSSELPYVWPNPPVGQEEPESFTAWVVRPVSADVSSAFRAESFVGLPADLGTSPTRSKKYRQFQRLGRAAAGDRIVVPEGGGLHHGRLVGSAVEREVAGQTYLTRAVRWEGSLPRSSLRRPYQLQDPQMMFPLRGEPALAG